MFSKANKYFGRLDVKLTFYYTSLLLIIAFILFCFIYYRLERNLIKQVDKVLLDEVYEIKSDVDESDFNIRLACETFEKEISHRKHYPIYFRVLTHAGSIYFESDASKKLSFPSFEQNRSSFLTFTNPGHSYPYRLYQKDFTLTDGNKFTIQIATVTKLSGKVLENYLQNITLAIPVLLILSIGCGMFISTKTRKILRNITTVTNRITSNNLQERLPVSHVKDEVQNLTITINNMIERLDKAFKEVKQFTSDVAHELRNPLFSLKGEMEVMLTKKRSDEEYREVIHECMERVNFIIKMVNDLFLISRFEAKKMDLDSTYLNLSEIVKDLFDFFLPMAQEKDLSFTIDRCDSVLINGDKTRINQLLNNLLDNAIKFTPKNGSVTLSLIAKNNTVQFMVKDNGIGIPKADIPHIFNRFYQVDKSRSGSLRGTGLGLNICKRIAEAHKGSIKIENNKDKGATFTLTLPIVE